MVYLGLRHMAQHRQPTASFGHYLTLFSLSNELADNVITYASTSDKLYIFSHYRRIVT